MDNWSLLKSELIYYGIVPENNKMCIVKKNNGKKVRQGIVRTVNDLNLAIDDQKDVFRKLWNGLSKVLSVKKDNGVCEDIPGKDCIVLFVSSIKDLEKYLLCFDGFDKQIYYSVIRNTLDNDIVNFDKETMESALSYKLSIDWIARNISRLLYIRKLLFAVSKGKKYLNKTEIIKTAAGFSGPWNNLDLPMEERVFQWDFDYGDEMKKREKAKQHQQRYTMGLNNYNSSWVGEGFVWRELRNEPFSWYNRSTDSPYPYRSPFRREF